MEDPRANLTNDQVLAAWEHSKTVLENAKEAEIEWRKYAATRHFQQPAEGVNTLELNNGYKLKYTRKLNYKLLDNDTVDKCVDRIAKIDKGIAERLISWTPNFLLTEYRKLEEDNSEEARQMLSLCHAMLVIDEAAPTLKIAEPKKAKR